MVTSKKGRHSGQKKSFKLEDIWRIRTRFESFSDNIKV